VNIVFLSPEGLVKKFLLEKKQKKITKFLLVWNYSSLRIGHHMPLENRFNLKINLGSTTLLLARLSQILVKVINI